MKKNNKNNKQMIEVKNLRKLKIELVAKAIFYTIVIYTLVLVGFNDYQAKKELANKKYIDTYTISQNETLWSIAEENAPKEMTIDEYIHELKNANETSLENIKAGQTINVIKFNK